MSRQGFWHARSGTTELKESYPINLIHGLLLSIMLHFLGVSAFWIAPRESSDPKSKNPSIIIRFPKNAVKTHDSRRPRTGNPPLAASKATIPILVPDWMPLFEPIVGSEIASNLSNSDSSKQWEWGGSPVGTDNSGGEEEPPIFDPRIESYPAPTKKVQPVYPEIAIRGRIEGTVHLRVLVGKDGMVRKAVVIKTDNSILERSALDAVNQWRFTPGMMGKDPVPVWMTIPFRFRLKE